jgi:hypothetical protein
MPARNTRDCLSALQRLFNQPNLVVVIPAPPTFSAQYLSPASLHKARLKVTSLDAPPNCTRRPPPERYTFRFGMTTEAIVASLVLQTANSKCRRSGYEPTW